VIGMAARKAFPLRISPDLYSELRRWAAAEFRSVNGQIEFLLRQAVRDRQRKRNPAENSSGGGGSKQSPPT
jgi:hypothetical protein